MLSESVVQHSQWSLVIAGALCFQSQWCCTVAGHALACTAAQVHDQACSRQGVQRLHRVPRTAVDYTSMEARSIRRQVAGLVGPYKEEHSPDGADQGQGLHAQHARQYQRRSIRAAAMHAQAVAGIMP